MNYLETSLITGFVFGFFAAFIWPFLRELVEQYLMRHHPSCDPKNRSPACMIQPPDLVAAVIERPWWEGGPDPK